MVLVTATASDQPREAVDFTPLVVDFEERFYAAGKIPGGFIKREGRPRNTAILSARLIDRSIRPLFPPLFYNDIQVVTTVLSVDELHPPEVISIIGASVALGISGIPFAGPLGACRLGIIGDEIILNPNLEELNESRLDLVLAASDKGITMIEAGGKEVSEEEVVKSLYKGYQLIQQIIKEQQEIIERIGKPKQEVQKPAHLESLESWLREKFLSQIQTTISIPEKSAREKEMKELLQKALQECEAEFATLEGFTYTWEKVVKEEINQLVLKTGKRQDGRTPKEIRPISCEVGVLPRTHGSALFTRGQTQVLAITTLGATSEEQKVDGLQEEEAKRFMLHYNFPPYSTGEVRPLRGPGRREIGHGALAERALECFIPPEEEFPYTIRVVSEVLESNGSSSMATVCGGSLSLMDAGVPIRTSCAGISIGLMFGENNDYVLLRDILGSEDHYGEMDFKVAGSRQGITAIQLDVKNHGLPVEILAEAIQEARESRFHILDIMDSVLSKPRSSVSKYAPRIATITISTDKIGALIGPGGKVIKKIIEETGTTIDIKEDGRVIVFSKTEEGKERAIEMIKAVTQDVEVGKIYLGKVTKTTDFGAFVELFPGREGLCHISQLSQERIRKVEDFVKVGDDLLVKVIGIDSLGRITLSHKEALASSAPRQEKERSRSFRKK
ncbi:MAG: polyribonucleotide nucleotidyltransferase [Candidatus Atribacteria bacterium]|nr:polyribonucleotide nucleotidyltransferase [Candidatus Atribacteria bacterium]